MTTQQRTQRQEPHGADKRALDLEHLLQQMLADLDQLQQHWLRNEDHTQATYDLGLLLRRHRRELRHHYRNQRRLERIERNQLWEAAE